MEQERLKAYTLIKNGARIHAESEKSEKGDYRVSSPV